MSKVNSFQRAVYEGAVSGPNWAVVDADGKPTRPEISTITLDYPLRNGSVLKADFMEIPEHTVYSRSGTLVGTVIDWQR